MDELISDHKFSPKGEWWSLCRHCNLAQAAHKESELHYYGDDVAFEEDEAEVELVEEEV